MSDDDFYHRLAIVSQSLDYYKYSGVINQIDLFFQNPFDSTNSLLRCSKIPDIDH